MYNPTADTALPYLIAKQLGTAEVWEAEIRRDPPQDQDPEEKRTATLYVNPPEDIPIGEKRVFTVSGYIEGELIGGIEVEVVKKRTTQLTCTLAPSTITIGNPVSITGTIIPILAGAKIYIIVVNPDGIRSQRTVFTTADGTYTDTITPDLTGTWSVSSTWVGDDFHIGSTSIEETIDVETEPPCIFILAILVVAVILYFRATDRRIKNLILVAIAIIIILYFLCTWL